MTLNNGATEYLYIDNFEKSRQLLEMALEESTDIGNFGQVYLYNNLCLTYLNQTDFIKAKECIELARTCKQREIEQLIIDINESALIASTEGVKIAIPLLERSSRNANRTGEKAYQIPAIVNLSYAYFEKGDIEKAFLLIKKIKPENLNSYSAYKNYHWFRLMEKCLKAVKDTNALTTHYEQYSWCKLNRNRKYYQTDYSFIDMQFWGD